MAWATKQFEFNQNDRFANFSKINFDVSILDIFGAFFSGARIIPVSNTEDRLLPSHFIREYKISVWTSVPSAFKLAHQMGHFQRLEYWQSLKKLIFCGEELPARLANDFITSNPQVALYNSYGPTETTVICSHYRVSQAQTSPKISIGKPTPGTNFKILSPEITTITSVNKVGILEISGEQVSMGYLNGSNLENKKFCNTNGERAYITGDLVYQDGDGFYYWVGREDNQVKINGYRIELQEIDENIKTISEILDSVTIYKKKEGPQLISFIVLKNKNENSVQIIKKMCEKLLPKYMVPNKIIAIEAIPLNLNGKVDRNKLAELTEQEEKI